MNITLLHCQIEWRTCLFAKGCKFVHNYLMMISLSEQISGGLSGRKISLALVLGIRSCPMIKRKILFMAFIFTALACKWTGTTVLTMNRKCDYLWDITSLVLEMAGDNLRLLVWWCSLTISCHHPSVTSQIQRLLQYPKACILRNDFWVLDIWLGNSVFGSSKSKRRYG